LHALHKWESSTARARHLGHALAVQRCMEWMQLAPGGIAHMTGQHVQQLCDVPSLSWESMRRVYHVQAEPLAGASSQPVAIKALSLRGLRGDWKALELFQREAKTLEALQHPGIPKYLEYFEVDTPRDKGFYLVQVNP
jgi:serine/threonine protein kinase